MKITLFDKLFSKLTRYLTKERPPRGPLPFDFDRLSYEIRPGDVLLIAGRSRVSEVIKFITQSHWSHTALYVGRLYDIESEEHRKIIEQHYQGPPSDQLLIESLMGKGIIVTPLTRYKGFHCRLCRPSNLSKHDAQSIINYTIERLGSEYDTRQALDLARFLFPWTILPRRWRSSLFHHNAGLATKQSCSSLIAEAFGAVNFPILPLIKETEQKQVVYIHRYPSLLTPSDFDFSPYFQIIKYPMFQPDEEGIYHKLGWREGVYSDQEGNVYTSEVVAPEKGKGEVEKE